LSYEAVMNTISRYGARYGGGASPPASIPGLPARNAALRLIDAVLRQGQTLDNVSAAALRGIAAHEDRALALAIAGEVLRRLPDLDVLIDSATAQPLPSDAKARSVLRIALVQTLLLGTPPHAAIATALPLVMGGPKRLVHGVFGTLMRQSAVLPEVPTLPADVMERWSVWGDAALADAALALAAPPPLDVMLRDADDDAGLGGESLAPGHRRLPRGTAIADLPGYSEGKWWVQNLAASVPVRLLGQGEGRTALDLCAAPGGKTMQLAASGWSVTAVDSHAKRLERVRENLDRTRLTADIVQADVMAWEPPARVDAILLDAPCTATGTFARHPDVLHRIGASDIAALSALQGRMLARAITWLKPGGRLVFATCSLEREEGEGIIEASGLANDPVAVDELPNGIAADENGNVRILPKPGLDGFFVSRLKAG
jgi:16S rRNA (cytosine967-C5)-methyltransferase